MVFEWGVLLFPTPVFTRSVDQLYADDQPKLSPFGNTCRATGSIATYLPAFASRLFMTLVIEILFLQTSAHAKETVRAHATK